MTCEHVTLDRDGFCLRCRNRPGAWSPEAELLRDVLLVVGIAAVVLYALIGRL